MTYHKNQPVVFNSSMKWKVNDDRLPCTVLHTTVFVQQGDNTETIVGECSFTIGEIYIYQPLTTWLNLHTSDEVKENSLLIFSMRDFILSNRHVGIEGKSVFLFVIIQQPIV
jgi:hypothetical protein